MEELPRKCEKFIYDNRDVLGILGKKLREADTVKQTRYSNYSEESRRLAIQLVEEWVGEIWNIAFSADDVYEDENDIIRIIDSKPE